MSKFYFPNVAPLRVFFSGGSKIVLHPLNTVKSYLVVFLHINSYYTQKKSLVFHRKKKNVYQ